MSRRRRSAGLVVALLALGGSFGATLALAGGLGSGTRERERPPFSGGMRIYVFLRDIDRANKCTAGIPLRNRFGDSVFITAGHCRGRFEYVFGGSDDGSDVSPTSEVGEMARNLYRGRAARQRSGATIDAATISLYRNSYAGRRVFTGGVDGSETRRISRTERPRVGREYCVSGSVSGLLCGFEATRAEHVVRIENGSEPDTWVRRVWRLKKDVKDSSPTGCTQAGDSGAPVFRLVGGRARVVGIHASGECDRDIVRDDSAVSYMVPLYVISEEMNMTFRLP